MASRIALALGWISVLAACGPQSIDGDDEVGDTDETAGTDETAETDETAGTDETGETGDGDGEGPVPIECEPGRGTPGEHLWTYNWAGSSGQIDEARGIDVDGAGHVIVGGITMGDGGSWNPWFSTLALDGTQLWSQELDLGEDRLVHDVAWIGPDAFVSAGGSAMGALLSSYEGQATLQWEDLRIVPGTCDSEFDAEASYVDLSVHSTGIAVGMVVVENIGDLCYEIDGGVELRNFAGDVSWSQNLPLGLVAQVQVGLGDGILFAAADGDLLGFDGDGASLWNHGVPVAQGLAIGRSGKLVTHRWDGLDDIGYLADRDASGEVVWEKQHSAAADDRRIGDLAIDPCDDSIVFTGSQADEVWVMKLDANGDQQWSTTLDLVPDADDMGLAVAIAGDGTIVVAGRQGDGYSDSFVAAFAG